MSQYTTGEIAKLCGVTVRTVQYYDNRGILCPSALTEGGRRLYSESDVRRLRVICFLRDAGLSVATVGKILAEEEPADLIELMVREQDLVLQQEIEQREAQRRRLTEILRGLRSMPDFTVESISDVANTMENRKKLNRLYRNMLLSGLPLALLQCAGIVLWIVMGWWQFFALWALAAVPYGILASRCYYRNVAYICPKCHETFRPAFRDAFFSAHTLRTRKLTCTCCGHNGYCMEVWNGK